MIPVKVTNLSISNVGFVVFLKSNDDERTLPIFIGAQEAQAIALMLNGVKPPRPLTHDLMKNMLDILEARLERVVINDLQDGTFYGTLIVAFESNTLTVDSRPSDGIALALRYNAPVFVAPNVMDEAGVVLEEQTHGEDEPPEEPPVEDYLTELKTRLEKAIQEERYEEAARLRDEIRDATQSN
ncbi:MAG: bifunctional nuclease family protein [Candidatus Pacebacteria bacterium]|nr:bifunctional nuclease family protein [Candidatus Paceibacterota bacterium]